MNQQEGNFQRLEEGTYNEIAQQQVPDQITKTYQIAQTVKIISIIDIFFNLLAAFYNPLFLVCSMLSYVGYIGAKLYNKKMLWGYFGYQSALVIARFIIPIVITTRDTDNNTLASLWLISILLIMLEGYLARFTYTLIKSINNLTPEELLRLQHIREMRVQYVYW